MKKYAGFMRIAGISRCFFKMIKQHLGLHALELKNYVSMVAYTGIVFMRYMMLYYYQRLQSD